MMNYKNLDDRSRFFMLQEVELDISGGILYFSKRFTDTGRRVYPALLIEAVKNHNDEWLAKELHQGGCFNSGEIRHNKNGSMSLARTPITAAETFAEGEFNRFYMRGICSRAIEEGIQEVTVYRGKLVTQPRPESQALIGTKIPALALLDDLRCPPGVQTVYGLPTGPNSGLTISLS